MREYMFNRCSTYVCLYDVYMIYMMYIWFVFVFIFMFVIPGRLLNNGPSATDFIFVCKLFVRPPPVRPPPPARPPEIAHFISFFDRLAFLGCV